MQNRLKADPSLIPPADARNLAMTFLEFVKSLYGDPKVMEEFKEWKARGEHKKYSL